MRHSLLYSQSPLPSTAKAHKLDGTNYFNPPATNHPAPFLRKHERWGEHKR